jgi:hypothetical protein
MKETTKKISLNTASLHSFASLCLLATAALGGCSEQRARFADATRPQLARAYWASSGTEMELGVVTALTIAAFAPSNDATSCPTVVTKGQDITLSGGCSTKDGARVEGSIAIHDLHGFEQMPPQPISIEFDHYVTSSKNENSALDGRVQLDPSGISGDLTLDTGGISSTSHLTLTCHVDIDSTAGLQLGKCTASPSSEIEISDLGSAGVEGTWSLTGPPSGLVTVRGADVLTFDIAHAQMGCVPYTITNKSDTLCPPPNKKGQALTGNRLQR